MKDLERKKYLGWLRKQKNQPLVKVITGVRGCGKTALLRRFQEELAEENAGKARVLAVDLESPEFEDLTDCEDLNRYLETQMSLGTWEKSFRSSGRKVGSSGNAAPFFS